MAILALPGKFAVVAHEPKSGFVGVVETSGIQRPKICVATLMFGMTNRAIAYCDLAMYPLPSRHSILNLIVANQTTISVGVEVIVVAVVATVWIFETFVGEAEPSRHEIDVLFLGADGHDAGRQKHRHQSSRDRFPGSANPPFDLWHFRLMSHGWHRNAPVPGFILN